MLSRALLLIAASVCGLLIWGCCASQTAKQPQSPATTDSTRTTPFAQSQPATAIKPNASIVYATVDAVALTDSIGYRLSVNIDSVTVPEGVTESFAQKGQRVVLTPQFVLTESGGVDLSNERNIRLLAMRDALEGETFSGRISLTSTGEWRLTEVISR